MSSDLKLVQSRRRDQRLAPAFKFVRDIANSLTGQKSEICIIAWTYHDSEGKTHYRVCMDGEGWEHDVRALINAIKESSGRQ